MGNKFKQSIEQYRLFSNLYSITEHCYEIAEELSQRLRAFTALAEDLGLDQAPMICALQLPVSTSRLSQGLFWLLLSLPCMLTQNPAYTCT